MGRWGKGGEKRERAKHTVINGTHFISASAESFPPLSVAQLPTRLRGRFKGIGHLVDL